MGQPSSILHIPRPLEDYVIAYRPDTAGYIGMTLMPKRSVKHRADQIRVENKGNLLRKLDLRVGSGGKLREVQFKMDDSKRFATIPYGVEVKLFRGEEADADVELQYAQRQMDTGLIHLYTNIEYVVVKEILRNVASWGAYTLNLALTPSQQYDKHNGTGDPVEDFLFICDRVSARTGGKRPNTIAMHEMVWSQIATHPRVLARGENQMGGLSIITPEQFEQMIRVEKGSIKITTANYNTAAENATDDFRSFIGPDIIFAYNEPGAINSYGLGQSFMFSGGASPAGPGLRDYAGGGADLPSGDIAVRAYDAPWEGLYGALNVKISTEFDAQLLNANAGFLLRNAVNGADTNLFESFLNN